MSNPTPVAARPSTPYAPIGLALALLLGLLAGVYTDSSGRAIFDNALAAILLALPPLLAVSFDPALRARPGALARVAAAVALALAAILLGDLLVNALQGQPRLDDGLFVLAALLLIPVSAAFALAGRGPRFRDNAPLAAGCGLVAWLGVGIHNLLIPFLLGFYSPSRNGNDFADLVFAVLVVLYAIGFGLAALAGLLGAALRAWLLRSGARFQPSGA
jgi:hypothetical protein